MVEKTVNICDSCKEKVAKNKCEICGKDNCEDCNREKMVGSMVSFLKYNLCPRCEDVLQYISINEPKIFEEIFENKPEIKQSILETLKNIIMLKKISEDDIPTKKNKNKLMLPISPTYVSPFAQNLFKKYKPPKTKYKQAPVDDELFGGNLYIQKKDN